jgi:DNA repair ATPase RecN
MEIFGKVLNLLQARLYAASLQSMVDRKSSDISSVISKMETKISELKNQVEEHKKALSNTNNKSKERQVLEAKISLGESFIGKLARDITDLRNPKTYTENPEWNDVPYLLMSINKNEKTDVISAEQDFSASLIRLCANTLKKKDGTPIEIMGKQLIDKDGNINFEMVDMIDANRYWLDGAKEYSDMENEYNYLKKAATVFKDTQNVVERQKEVLEGIKESYASFEKVNGRIMDLTNAKIDINASSFASKIVNFRKNKDQKDSIDSEMETIKELEGKLMNQIMETAKSFIINLEHYRIVRYEADPKEFPYASNNPALDDKQMREALGKHFNDIVFSKNASLEEKKAE